MKFSPNFDQAEFEKNDPMPDECKPVFIVLCNEILEVVRGHFGKRVKITSGYRSPKHNALIGGSATSQHVATESYCAADFQVEDTDPADVFNWMRSQPLPYDQLILEYGRVKESDLDDCIHVSYKMYAPRRVALIGATHGRGKYVRVDSAPLTTA